MHFAQQMITGIPECKVIGKVPGIRRHREDRPKMRQVGRPDSTRSGFLISMKTTGFKPGAHITTNQRLFLDEFAAPAHSVHIGIRIQCLRSRKRHGACAFIIDRKQTFRRRDNPATDSRQQGQANKSRRIFHPQLVEQIKQIAITRQVNSDRPRAHGFFNLTTMDCRQCLFDQTFIMPAIDNHRRFSRRPVSRHAPVVIADPVQQAGKVSLGRGHGDIMRRAVRSDKLCPAIPDQQISPNQFSRITIKIIIPGEGKSRTVIGEVHRPFRPSTGK